MTIIILVYTLGHLKAVLDPVTRVGPRGQGPSKNRQGPGKNYWTVQVKKIEKDQMATL